MSLAPISPITTLDPITAINAQTDAENAAEAYQINKEAAKEARAAKFAKSDAAALLQEKKDAEEEAQTVKNEKTDTAARIRKNKIAKEDAQAAEYAKSDAITYQNNKDALENVLSAKTDQAVVSQRAANSAASLAAKFASDRISSDEAHQAIEAYQANSAEQKAVQADKTTKINETGSAMPHINIQD